MEEKEIKTEETKVEEVKPQQTKKKGKAGIIIAVVAIVVLILLIAIFAIAGLIIFLTVRHGGKTTTTVPRTSQVDNKITITFVTNCDDSVRPMDYVPGEDFTLPTPSYKDHTFDGWFLEDNTTQVTDEYEFTESITLYAHWTEIPADAKTLTVTFDSKGGSKVKSMKFTCDSDNAATLKNLPKPTKDSYEFRTWEDKHGTPILNDAKITCDGELKLYAVWEYDGPTAAPKLKCNVGTLDGENCVDTKEPKTKCPDGTKADGDLCIKTSDSNTGTRVCKEDTIAYDGKGHTWTGRGDYYMVGSSYGKCAYYKWTSYTTKSACEAAYDVYHKTTWVSELNACYSETKVGNYETQCANDYKWYTSGELSSKFGIHNDGRCLKKVDKTSYCDDGYTLSGNKCVKVLGKATPVE